MRYSPPVWLVIAASCACLGAPNHAAAAPMDSDSYHIVLPRNALGAGESVALRLEPPPPPGVRVNYGLLGAGIARADVRMTVEGMGIGLLDGIYRAPYVIPPGTPPVRVTANFSTATFRAGAVVEIQLLPGRVPGSEDCLGPGQSFSSQSADLVPSYIQVDELPEAISHVAPEYPRSAFVRGVEDTIAVKALVCRSGRVLDAIPLRGFRDNQEPIESDSKLVQAALDAVRQYVFSPARVAGQPVAVWVVVPVAFRQ